MSWTIRQEKPAAPAQKAAASPKESYRETIESIVVAFILALLIRGFEAEAFVIPTGSMAPTLMGQHKEVACPQCLYVFPINAAEEKEPVAWGSCANCRCQIRVDGEPSFKGDRILVMKFPYDLARLPGAGRPQRWDVVVFKYPEKPEVNYIKRLVGLPGEELRIDGGDLMSRPLGSGQPFQKARKPLQHQQAMQMIVYDDAYRPLYLKGLPPWQRWVASGPGTCVEEEAGTFVASSPSAADWTELRYRHLVPDPYQWAAILAQSKAVSPPRPTLITDFYSYNSNQTNEDYQGGPRLPEPHWVGDLTLAFRLQVTAPSGRVRVDLVEGGVVNRCEIDLESGLATLTHDGQPLGEPKPSGVRGTGTFDMTFANVDDRLTLWVDGRTPFGEGLVYDDGPSAHPIPTVADLDPVGIGLRGTEAQVSRLVLKRDIYYTLRPSAVDHDVTGVFDLLADPARYSQFADPPPSDFAIAPGRYMMMGDNSPMSSDSRAWHQEDQIIPDRAQRGWDPSPRKSWEVPERLLIGKAFFVYWPHGKPFGPEVALSPNFRFPFRPYLERMKWIR